MFKSKQPIDDKVKAYIEKLFAGVTPTQQLFELKEELATNIGEKIADYQARGMEAEQAFKEAIISMGDLSGLVEDMRQLGQDTARQTVYTTMNARISTAGIIAGVLLVLFGIFTSAIIYFKDSSLGNAFGPGIFVVGGGALLTYSFLTRETQKRYAMNKVRAALYALSAGLILFGIFSAVTSGFNTGKVFVAIAALMVFSLIGIGLWLSLILTGTDRRKIQ